MPDATDSGATGRSRRDFMMATTGLSAAGLAGLAANTVVAQQTDTARQRIDNEDVILFQGDSITDAGRDRRTADVPNRQPAMGSGYAWLSAAAMLTDRPENGLKIYNRGISGHKVFQLADRWQEDCLDLQPNLLSILIGVNDIWHQLNGNYDGTLEKYECDYHQLVLRTKEELPAVKLVICEPFVLKCGAVNDRWFPEFDGFRAAAGRVASDTGAVFVPFQTLFDRAIDYAPPEHWAADGVHPSPAGAALMAHCWLNAVFA